MVYSYVVEEPGTKQVTDMVSFYSLPSSVLGNDKHKTLLAAYSYYYFHHATPLLQLMNDALILAKRHEFDVRRQAPVPVGPPSPSLPSTASAYLPLPPRPSRAARQVFNALDILENESFLKELKFGIGDGNLHYYIFNWRCPPAVPGEVGLVLL